MDESINKNGNKLLQDVIAEIQQLVSVETSRESLFDNLCLLLVEKARYRMAWVGMADFETGEVNVEASHGVKGNYFEVIDIRCDEGPLGQGPTGRAIRHGLHQINHDTSLISNYAPWRDAAGKLCFRSSAAFPFRHNGKVVGVINIYSGEPYAFGREVTELLDSVAELAGQGLDRLDAV